MDNYFKVPFANAGDKTAIPEDTQANGSVSYTTGYGLDYQKQRGVDADAKAIERDKMNSLLFKTTAAIQALQTFGGASAFITAADNGGTAYSYSKGARVSLSGVVYESLTNANTTTPPGANWQIVNWGDVVSFFDSRFVNVSGDTLTGPLFMAQASPGSANKGYLFDSDTGMTSSAEGKIDFWSNGTNIANLRRGGGGTFEDRQLIIRDPGAESVGIGVEGATAGQLRLRAGRWEAVNPDGTTAMPFEFATVENPGQTSLQGVNTAALINYAHQVQGGGQMGIKLGHMFILSGHENFGDIPAGTVSRRSVTLSGFSSAPNVIVSWSEPSGFGAGGSISVWADQIGAGGFSIAAEETGGNYVQKGGVSWIAIGPASA